MISSFNQLPSGASSLECSETIASSFVSRSNTVQRALGSDAFEGKRR